MMVKGLKSQAALEFLTTYGWAFLVIMIMIGSLAYFGILNPSKLLPNRCNLGSEFTCVDYQISETANTFKIKLKNNVGETIAVAAASGKLKKEDGTDIGGCSIVAADAVSNWVFSKTANIVWTGCTVGTWNKGDKAKVLFTLEYTTATTGAYARQVQGEVYAIVT